MEPIWLPAPEAVKDRLVEIATAGFKNFMLVEHLGIHCSALLLVSSLAHLSVFHWDMRWVRPIGSAVGLTPLLNLCALFHRLLIPLVIIWAGIGEVGKIILLFLAAL